MAKERILISMNMDNAMPIISKTKCCFPCGNKKCKAQALNRLPIQNSKKFTMRINLFFGAFQNIGKYGQTLPFLIYFSKFAG